jgi:arylsulfatase A-like enzyme
VRILLLALAFSPAAVASPPNIVVILTDDMGYSDLGCYGGEIATPNLDALAAGGVRFTQFYNTARCCPTRASLLTGLDPHRAGIGHMMDDKGHPGYRGNLSAECRTMAEVLRTAGYRNYATGKWHVTRHAGADGPKNNWPLARGFDRFYGTIHGAGSYFDPSSLVRDHTMISPYDDTDYRPAQYYYTDAIAHHAAKYVTDHAAKEADKPFSLYVAFTAAHWPMHALPEDIAKYRGKYAAGFDAVRQARFERGVKLGVMDARQPMAAGADWAAVPDKAWEAAGMEVYAAMVDRMDRGVGTITSALKAAGKYDNTIIYYMQDNGGCAETTGRTATAKHPAGPRPEKPAFPAMKPADFAAAGSTPAQTRDGYPVRMGRGVMPGPDDTYIAYGAGWANVSNTPFREYKHWVHEGGISTPLIVHWPAGIAAKGALRQTPGHLVDIAATCYAAAGAQYPKGAPALDGIDLRPAFAAERIARPALFWEHEGNRAVRDGDWKLVAKFGKPWELYNISDDRVERNDLAGKQPERVAAMAKQYAQYAERSKVVEWSQLSGKKK